MRSRVGSYFVAMALLACGCKGGGKKLLAAPPAKAPSGWSIVDFKQVPFTLAIPNGMEPKVLSANELQNAQTLASGAKITDSGITALKQGESNRVIIGFKLAADHALTEDEATNGFQKGFESTGGTIKDFQETTVMLPVGSARLLTGKLVVNGRPGELAYYVIVDGKEAYNLGIMDFPSQESTRIDAQTLAESFRPRSN